MSLLSIKNYQQIITGMLRDISILKIVCCVTAIKQSKAKMNENEDE